MVVKLLVSEVINIMIEMFAGWIYTVDREATIEAYARSGLGGVETCGCSGCRNFRLVRTEVFPSPFMQLLDSLGVDPYKDAEIYHVAKEYFGHIYGGWFHFVGTLSDNLQSEVSVTSNFSARLCRHSAPCLEVFDGLELVEIQFSATEVPWRLPEIELT